MSFRYPAGLITAGSPVVPQYPTGVWTNQQAAPYIQNNVWGVDPNFANTTLLLHGDGTNGAQNNTFLDSSTNNFTITRNGNTTQGTFTPFSKVDGRWGNFFDGSGDVLSIASNSALNMNTYASLEAWVYLGSSGASQLIVGRDASYWLAYNFTGIGGTANKFVFTIYNGSSWQAVSSTTSPSLNTWYHVVGVKDNTTLRIYLNGVQEATATFSGTAVTSSTVFYIAANNNVEFFTGYISNLRFVLGASSTVLPYTGNFTTPTAPLTAVSGTQLLTCQSNRFVDNSSNNFTITRNGDVKVTTFSPFPTLTAYAAATNGGSGYFDGSGDYLELPLAINSQIGALAGKQRTFEFWINTSEIAAVTAYNMGLFGNLVSVAVNGRYSIVLLGSSTTSPQSVQFAWTTSTSTIAGVTATTTLNQKSWNHVAITVNATTSSSTTIVIYINGVGQTFTGQNLSSQTSDPNYNFRLGDTLAGDQTYRGFIGGFKISSGIQRSENFTPPTTPFTSDANTILLTNFTNAGIIDNSMSNNLETVGDAQIDTTTKKYGTGSMEFDGSGDYLVMKDTPEMVFGTGDFTIEFWINTNQTANEFAIIDFRAANGAFPFIAHDSTRGVFYYLNTNYRIESNTVLTTGVWYHIAVARSGSSTKLFIDGTQAGSTFTDSTSLSVGANRPIIGTNGANVGTLPLNGYIDDLRITKGIARYTANFTPPTAAFPNIGQ